MAMSERQRIEQEGVRMFTPGEVQRLNDDFLDDVLEACVTAYRSHSELPENERLNARWQKGREVVEAFSKRMLQEKGRFERVFKTGNGSYYFLLPGGESFRIKMFSGDKEFRSSDYPGVMKNIFFIEKEELEKVFSKLRNIDDLRGQEIRLSDFSEGTHPLEVNKWDDIFEIQIEEREDEEGHRIIVMTGSKDVERMEDQRGLLGGIHYGHAITEVLK